MGDLRSSSSSAGRPIPRLTVTVQLCVRSGKEIAPDYVFEGLRLNYVGPSPEDSKLNARL